MRREKKRFGQIKRKKDDENKKKWQQICEREEEKMKNQSIKFKSYNDTN